MKAIAFSAALAVLAVSSFPGVAFAKREANDLRRICREAIQKSSGAGKDAKVSGKAIDRCVANGGRL
ncbi:hypothetical protein DWF00_02685 [Bosea caraganae]|uniref:Uncharacterized protein n=1 Tax=Bosea caraganae TaxID=2763117 RepID=A0A370L2V4_9HYPH|nr:hypothetical protein [Bosea caraganae]RDJ22501.1 hypothetical protein DWE98_18850 [Bosea caraganae]RDJ30460.1 hypothetical protein DWF00_02685 [Bosea caraganae]